MPTEITEVKQTQFSECTLGKAAEDWKIAKSEAKKPDSRYYDVSLAMITTDLRNCPIENGQWTGERGKSKWMPDADFIPQKENLEGKSWGEIQTEFGIDGICFEDGEPVFNDISKGTVIIEGFSSRRDDNFDRADIELAKQHGCTPEEIRKWRMENRYTWHECRDMETMQKVPRVIHNNVSHRGGVSNAKSMETGYGG